jgi:hypothetical protein
LTVVSESGLGTLDVVAPGSSDWQKASEGVVSTRVRNRAKSPIRIVFSLLRTFVVPPSGYIAIVQLRVGGSGEKTWEKAGEKPCCQVSHRAVYYIKTTNGGDAGDWYT